MEFVEIVELINTVGFSVVLMAYFLIKDWKFNQSITGILTEIKEVLTELKTWHAKEDNSK